MIKDIIRFTVVRRSKLPYAESVHPEIMVGDSAVWLEYYQEKSKEYQLQTCSAEFRTNRKTFSTREGEIFLIDNILCRVVESRRGAYLEQFKIMKK